MRHAAHVRGFQVWLHLMMKGRDAVHQDVFFNKPAPKTTDHVHDEVPLDESRHIYIGNRKIKFPRDVLSKHLHHYETVFVCCCFFLNNFTKTLTDTEPSFGENR